MRRLTERQRIAAIVLSILAVLFLVLDVAGGSLRSAHNGVRGALGALYRGTDVVLGPVRSFVAGVPTAGSNKDRIASLEHQNALLRGQLADARLDRTTAAELAGLQLQASAMKRHILPARVIALGPGSGFDWTVTIDAGTTSGVRVDQTVTDGAGLVGRVLHADASTAVVLLAVDLKSGVGVRDDANGELGIASGEGLHGFEFTPMDTNATVKVGDVLSTGPVGGTSFAPGIVVGAVTQVRVSADGITRATVRPTVGASTLDLVGVVDTVTATGPGSRAALQPGVTR
jgi:rod shape-determining protein MreC